jgi:hypothetical protein
MVVLASSDTTVTVRTSPPSFSFNRVASSTAFLSKSLIFLGASTMIRRCLAVSTFNWGTSMACLADTIILTMFHSPKYCLTICSSLHHSFSKNLFAASHTDNQPKVIDSRLDS